MGWLFRIVISNSTPDGEIGVGMKPLVKPPIRGLHGPSKLDCTTEWFFGWKLNRTTVFLGSMTLLGSNVSFPSLPTSTSVLRRPPTGSPSAGDVLVGAFLASSANFSKVFPSVGLARRLAMMGPSWGTT